MPENELLTRAIAVRKENLDAMEVILKGAESGKRDLSTAEKTEWATRSAAVDSANARVEQIKAREASDAASNAMLDKYLGPRSGNGAIEPSWLPNAREYHEAVAEQRVSGYGNAAALLGVQQYNGWFGRLRTKSVLLAAGPRIIPIDGRSMSVPVLSGSATVATYDEGSAITASDPAVSGVVLQPVAHKALVIASNESLLDSSPELQQIIADDLLRTMATSVDVSLLVGPGGAAPRKVLGLRNTVGVTAGPDLGAAGGVPTVDTFVDMIGLLEGIGGDISRAAFFVSPAIWSLVRKIRAIANGNFLLTPDISAAAKTTLWGVPVYVSKNIPQTEVKGASGAVTSSIMLVDLDQVVVGIGKDVAIEQSSDAYFGSDSTGIRCVSRIDIAALNPAAIVLTTGAKVS